MKLPSNPPPSSSSEQDLAQCEQVLPEQVDLTAASVRNYLGDVRHFSAWFEQHEGGGAADTHDVSGFHPHAISTPALTCYRTYLQTERRQKPTSVNRFPIGLKCSFGWVTQHHFITYDLSDAVTLLAQVEQAFVAAVTEAGNLRDRTLIFFLNAGNRCDLQQAVETIAWT